jgi:CRISPR system Cascade subunit CasE
VFVKSKLKPDFSKLPANYVAAMAGREPPTATRDLEGFLASLGNGSVLRFRLKANATRRLSKTREKDSLAGKRVAVRGDKPLMEWLTRKGTQHGFELISASIGKDVLDVISRPSGVEQGRAIARAAARVLADDDGGESVTTASAPLPEKKKTITAEGVVFDGRLRITDRGRFLEALRAGIGTGKSYGFGLLSVAPLS